VKEIEGCSGLIGESAPQMHWKCWVGSTEGGNEVIFPSGNGFLGGVATMRVGRDELKRYVIELAGCFVVKPLKNGLEATVAKKVWSLV
jgi:hypothetical protein